jgi:putative protein kinase ArgK-like GTPase of G3E family
MAARHLHIGWGTVYLDQVLPYIVREATPVEKPYVILVGGQPGAGKSVALQHAGKSLTRAGLAMP